VMVHQINSLKGDQPALSRATIIAGAAGRLRAIFLTTVTTVAGVLPTAYGLGGESGFTQPIAFSMLWGLLTSTFMTLLVLPACLMVQEDFFLLFRRVFLRRRELDGKLD